MTIVIVFESIVCVNVYMYVFSQIDGCIISIHTYTSTLFRNVKGSHILHVIYTTYSCINF